jgi:hypothetical protein
MHINVQKASYIINTVFFLHANIYMYLSSAMYFTNDGHKSGQNMYMEYYVYKDISSKPKKFKIALKHYLLTHSFYSLD